MGNPFASDDRPPPAPAPLPTPPPTMPDPQSPDAMAAKRRAQQDVMGRAGRSSTILSTGVARAAGQLKEAGAFNGGTFSGTKLGSST